MILLSKIKFITNISRSKQKEKKKICQNYARMQLTN